MLKIIKRLFKPNDDSTESEREIDYDNCWIITEIPNKNKFIKEILDCLPENCIWSIEGMFDKGIYDTISDFIILDEKKKTKYTVWPKHNFFEVKLTNEARSKVLENIMEWDFDANFIHQNIFSENHCYLTSFDNLHRACTWISDFFEISKLNDLKKKGILDFEKS
ncbi:hypothetical protein [Tenacibaculum ovolyticum]|uniref:hypothetical protein n=1 Tax=Tenacibaculum ovolyticum TaxID=104270 RepID=UPI000400925B|nr:hypothetical protein [Tenacibaculum ovolyticum]